MYTFVESEFGLSSRKSIKKWNSITDVFATATAQTAHVG